MKLRLFILAAVGFAVLASGASAQPFPPPPPPGLGPGWGPGPPPPPPPPPPGPGYYGAGPAYGGDCYIVRRRVWTDYGWRYRRVRVCN